MGDNAPREFTGYEGAGYDAYHGAGSLLADAPGPHFPALNTDDHLTYVSSGRSRYDVYGSSRGPMLGIVERHGRMWAAISVEDGLRTVGDTRREAAAGAWPA